MSRSPVAKCPGPIDQIGIIRRGQRPTVFYFGIDLHSKTSQVCEISFKGMLLRNVSISTTPTGLGCLFRGLARSRIVMEVGGETPWVRRVLEEMGHEVMADSFERWERLDNIGPARYGELDELTNVVIREVEP